MWVIKKQWFGWWTGRRGAGAGMALALLNGIAGAIFAIHTQAAVIEFFNPDLNAYFITADAVEQAFVDTGAVGHWQRTGYGFAAGGPSQVCRFGGNSDINPATGTFFGPNSHFYTADPAECAGLKAIYTTGAKSWKFESNDFPTTPAVNGGCRAGLTPVYRAYNNGFARGIDSNHRITSNHAAYLQTVAAGSIGEGVVMCAPSPAATAVGVATGSAANATIGAAGGSVSTPDSKISVTIPAGALAANMVIGIQPLTNLAHGKVGAAYRLTPDGQTFLMPVTLKFTYTDLDLDGSAAELFGIAFQTADGYWQWAGNATLDTTAKTVSIASNHFSVWSMVKEVQMQPAKKIVKVNGTASLEVVQCYEPKSPDPRGYLCSVSDDNDDLAGLLPSGTHVSEWSVNGSLGGGDVFGRVVGSGTTATYTAPTSIPIPNPVAVSARIDRGATATRVASVITIADVAWSGTAVGELLIRTLTVDLTWVMDSFINNVAVFSPTGTAGAASISDVNAPGCVARYDPPFAPIKPTDGSLTIDYNTTPPSYHGWGFTYWSAVLTAISGDCTGQTGHTVAGGSFFGGSSGALLEATGVLSPDGKTIEGSATDTQSPPDSFHWKFTRDQIQ